jgi:starch synthase
MRLLYLSADPGVPVFGHKGASVHLREMASAFSEAGASVIVASPRLAPGGDRLPCTVETAPMPPVLPREHAHADSLQAAICEQAEYVIALARRSGAQAVYERYSLFSRAGVEAAAALGVPHLLEVNAPLREEARRFRTLAHPQVAAAAEAHVYERTDRMLAVSEVLAAMLRADGADAAKIEVVPNAVSAERFPDRRAPRGPVVGFAGSLKPWHGIDVLLRAVRIALAHVPRLRLEIVGDGPLRSALADPGIPPRRFRYRGALSHRATIAAMSSWTVGVAPYLPIGEFYFSPLKVLEYMAAGLCTVASNLGGLPALLDHGRRGVLVPAGDADALAGALVALSLDPARTEATAARARAYARTLGWARNAARALDTLRVAAAGRCAA